MTTGALIFAFTNPHIDYVRIAAWSANRIQKWLGIPVCCVTDYDDVPAGWFDQIIHADRPISNDRWFADYALTGSWFNRQRCKAFDLTPWSRTLLLDADYVISSTMLKPLLDSDVDFACHRNCHDIAGSDQLDDSKTFGRNRMPMWWATVMLFDRGSRSRVIFESMKMIESNWQHYCKLYAINQRTFRNDIALSIAINIESGHTLSTNDIPWSLGSVMPDHHLTMIDDDAFRVDFIDAGKRSRYINLVDTDFHALNKKDLGAILERT